MARVEIGATFTSIISDQGPMTRSRVPQALIKALGAEDGNVFHYEIVGNNDVRLSVLRGKNAERALAQREPAPAAKPARPVAKKAAKKVSRNDDFDKAFSKGLKSPAKKVAIKPAKKGVSPNVRGLAAAAIKAAAAKKRR